MMRKSIDCLGLRPLLSLRGAQRRGSLNHAGLTIAHCQIRLPLKETP